MRILQNFLKQLFLQVIYGEMPSKTVTGSPKKFLKSVTTAAIAGAWF